MFRSAALAHSVRARSDRAWSGRPRRSAPLAIGVTLAAALGVGACRDVTAPDQNPATVAYAASLGIRLSDYTKDTSGVYYQDVAVGSGVKAIPNSTLSYYYTGYLTDGRKFGTNVGTTSPLTFVIGTGQVVRGFDRGLLGIAAGGRRRLIIPPALGYGDKSSNNAIPAGSVLIFEVDVPAITLPTTTTTTSS